MTGCVPNPDGKESIDKWMLRKWGLQVQKAKLCCGSSPVPASKETLFYSQPLIGAGTCFSAGPKSKNPQFWECKNSARILSPLEGLV